jgi:hypothetical protein
LSIAARGFPNCRAEECSIAGFRYLTFEAYMKTHFTNEQIQSICKPAEPKVASLIELIRQAQASQKENA